MTTERFAYIWQYTIDPAHERAFLAAYGPQGEWVRLFSRDPAYIETLLLRDDERKDRYMTIDYWKSRSERDAFRERYSVEFEDLDSRCEAFTREEQFIGDFQEIGVVSS